MSCDGRVPGIFFPESLNYIHGGLMNRPSPIKYFSTYPRLFPCSSAGCSRTREGKDSVVPLPPYHMSQALCTCGYRMPLSGPHSVADTACFA